MCFPFLVVSQDIITFCVLWVHFEEGIQNFQGYFWLQGLLVRFLVPSVPVSTFNRYFLLHCFSNCLLVWQLLHVLTSMFSTVSSSIEVCHGAPPSLPALLFIFPSVYQFYSRYFSRWGWTMMSALGLSGTGCDGPRAALVFSHHALPPPSSKAPYVHTCINVCVCVCVCTHKCT